MEHTVQEALAVCDETTLVLKVLCLLTEAVNNEKEVKEVFGADMSYLFHEHIYLEAQYDRLISAAGIAGVLLQEDADKVLKLAQQVKDSFRLICRFIRRHPDPETLFDRLSFDVLERVKTIHTYREWTDMAIPLGDYMEIIKRRMQSSEEKNEMDHDTVLLHLEMTKQHCQDRAARLEGVLMNHKRKRAKRRAEGLKVVQTLRKEKDLLLAKIEAERGVTRNSMLNEINEMDTKLKEKKKTVKEAVKTKTSDLGKKSYKNQEQEFLHIRKTRHAKVETEKIIKHYDAKMISLTEQFEHTEMLYQRDKPKVEVLQAKVKALTDQRVQWEKLLAERRRKAEEAFRLLHTSAARIQAYYRGWQTRNRLKKAKRKKARKTKKKR